MHATREEARNNWDCPLSKTFAQPQMSCRGDLCPIWRWTTMGPWADAVAKVAKEIDDKTGPKAKAAAIVAKNPAAHGCHGYCGLGGGL